MNLTEVLKDRCSEKYERARLLSRTGQIISRSSLVFTLLPFLFGISEAGEGRMGPIFLLWGFTGLLAVLGYGIGQLVVAQSEALSASIDVAVNSPGAFSDAVREELLAVTRDRKSEGLRLNLNVAVPAVRSGNDSSNHYSPIAALIATPISSYSHFTPLPRIERRLARPNRRRAH